MATSGSFEWKGVTKYYSRKNCTFCLTAVSNDVLFPPIPWEVLPSILEYCYKLPTPERFIVRLPSEDRYFTQVQCPPKTLQAFLGGNLPVPHQSLLWKFEIYFSVIKGQSSPPDPIASRTGLDFKIRTILSKSTTSKLTLYCDIYDEVQTRRIVSRRTRTHLELERRDPTRKREKHETHLRKLYAEQDCRVSAAPSETTSKNANHSSTFSDSAKMPRPTHRDHQFDSIQFDIIRMGALVSGKQVMLGNSVTSPSWMTAAGLISRRVRVGRLSKHAFR
ncbi:hypothetical protein MPTK1_6g13070 [Marchantia polymorpha subsp. ruderalis]|uniref:Uncharacterized protein n=2 Tax=Marchantia polymorpha TaxID=3197 RepID=A0AAF6BRJ4_MARPO|nr:hypothetical protein MARPO_0059s0100 [Marchantia polymorpha]BBN14628.1 hypothetical protein Mp_6g13070 [Marchantia polymorpha subsp. ruderalis]|eukprot:PTQ37175.1 hypothetical protein MARPO_0059s0100 [Marchantia polymorpha]